MPENDSDQKSVVSQSQIYTYSRSHPSISVDEYTSYEKKIKVINGALQEIGMGRYQWNLFIVTGFGYFSDNLWPIVTGLILPVVANEFQFRGAFLKLGQNIGLLVGAAFWGLAADIWGRRISFNVTLLITGVFAISAGASPNYIVLTSFAAAWSVGVGGNLPVDSAIFLEFVPQQNQYLLTVLSIWWAFGQLIGSLIAWPLIGNFSCPTSAHSSCKRSENEGWRYFLFTMGGLMLLFWIFRIFFFTLYESPKYLVGKGRDQEALHTVHVVAAYNRTTTSLKAEDFSVSHSSSEGNVFLENTGPVRFIRDQLGAVRGLSAATTSNTNRIRALFIGPQMARSTTLLISLWALIGLAFPLYNSFVTYYLETRGADFGDGSIYITYRNQVIISVIGIPGAIIGGYMVEVPALGRRGTLSLFTVLTGVFILSSTTARSSNSLLAWNCAYSFTSNIMYGVLYAITPELFLTKDRGTGNAITATANRIFGVMAPIIALYADLTTSVPIFIAGAIFIVSAILPLLLPFDTQGTAAL
ncbi:hypothetical protein HYPSUDRAFT_195756 [Hypholoma sublateritium FD-334 SS-4]|uniref:Major facilitator superfamily (MFS) profile domain-containing protein n=1 Tax=Hypholoma sublateritium (strain FD-334 SS-4) TaxID=945553 RepID=A0A0D2N2F4_HYPSF|nr:hypothetical protein HYPSUDRAFT_195756 [Hypholoma sublateritium FD-334 SS-4]